LGSRAEGGGLKRMVRAVRGSLRLPTWWAPPSLLGARQVTLGGLGTLAPAKRFAGKTHIIRLDFYDSTLRQIKRGEIQKHKKRMIP